MTTRGELVRPCADELTSRRTIILILPMARDGFSPFGQSSVQLRIVRQRNSR
jgi:hypothetical protein